MKHNIKLVVFDIAGTTVKDNGEITKAFQAAMEENGYNIPGEKISALMGYKKTDAITKMLREFEKDSSKITEEYVDSIHDVFVQKMIDYYKSTPELEVLPFATEMFKYLKEKEITIGLDTGFYSYITDVIIQRLGWLENNTVDYVISSNQVKSGRPDPFMIEALMQRASIEDPKQVIKIGDTEVDVNEGKNAGCLFSLAVTTGAFNRKELEPYNPDYILDSLAELPAILEN